MEPNIMKMTLVVVFILVVVAHADAGPQPRQVQQQKPAAPTQKIDCPSKCLVRCGNNWKNEMCNKMCNICCNRCSCVPPGTGQNTRHLCPCYDTMLNSKTKKPKCP